MKNEILKYLKNSNDDFYIKSKKIEELNRNYLNGNNLAAYYTNENVVKLMVDKLPNFDDLTEITILEPSVGIGNFIPYLIEKYKNKKINFILNDIDNFIIECLNLVFKNQENINFNFTNEDFLQTNLFDSIKIDLIIGNPPYIKIKDKKYLKQIKSIYEDKTNNIYAYFIQKSLKISKNISFIVPKSLLFVNEFQKTRNLLNKNIINIIDYEQSAFNIRMETISFIYSNNNSNDNKCEILNYKNKISIIQNNDYIFDENLPIWLLYRNKNFDETLNKLELDIFNVYRDRQITNSMLNQDKKGKWILRGQNLQSEIIHVENYDKYCDKENLQIEKFIDKNSKNDILIAPNLTPKPRFHILPKNTLVNGSIGLFVLKKELEITKKDIEFLNSKEFQDYFDIVRNKSMFSINLDNNIGYFFGVLK